MSDVELFGFLASCDIFHHLGRVVHLDLIELPEAEVVDEIRYIAAEVWMIRHLVEFCNFW
jgi:hypothetical protein